MVKESANLPWYAEGPILAYLEQIDASDDPGERPLRLPVQYVIRPMRHEYHDYRGYAGTIADGVVRVGQEVEILPSGKTTHITAVETPDGEIEQASGRTAVTVRLADQLDVSRGDMISETDGAPRTTRTFDATICWMSEVTQLQQGATLRIKHTTRTTRAMITSIDSQIDINTLAARTDCTALKLNEIGRVSIRTSTPLVCDDYTYNRKTGSFILIDESTNETVAAGMIGRPGFGDFASL